MNAALRFEQARTIPNLCRHRISVLLDERGKTRLINCPCHPWTYALGGQLHGAPAPTPDQFAGFVTRTAGMWASQPDWTAADLATITTPTAVVLGEHDEAILRAHAEMMASAIPGAALVILPAVSHFAMLQAPDDYNAAVRAFID